MIKDNLFKTAAILAGSSGLFLSMNTSCSGNKSLEAEVKGPSRPNILLIITDDQGWGDISSHGNDTLRTPNLDRLASESYRFDRFYVSPVCAPTRASLLTGRYHLRTGVHGVTGRREVMRNTELTIAEFFRSGDYQTSYFGKWHNGAQYPHNPNGQGFDYFFGFCAGHWNIYFDTWLEYNGAFKKTDGYITDVLTDSAVAKINNAGPVPFFNYVSYNVPHTPFQVPDKYFNYYKDLGLSDKKASVFGMVENIDHNIGRLLNALEESGKMENTIVIFLSDNGPNTWRYNAGLKGRKAWVDEGGVRVPMFMRVPWLNTEEVRISQMTAHIDLFPTLASLCNQQLPNGLKIDGIDLSPMLRNPEKKQISRYIYTDRGLGKKTPYAIRSDRYLLTTGRDTLLFDLEADSLQQNDISSRNPDLVRDLLKRYDAWYHDVTAFGLKPPVVATGYRAAPVTLLPAHEAGKSGNTRFAEGNGWANDYMVNIREESDRVTWKLKVVEKGKYRIKLQIGSPAANIGKRLVLDYGLLEQRHVFDREYNSIPIPSPDRVKRKEAIEKSWDTLDMGSFYLDRKTLELELHPDETGLAVPVEIKSMIVEKENNK